MNWWLYRISSSLPQQSRKKRWCLLLFVVGQMSVFVNFLKLLKLHWGSSRSHLQYPLLNQQAPFCGGRRSPWLWKSDDLRSGRRGTDFESCHCGGEVWHKIARFQDELHKFALNFEISDLHVIAHDESLYIYIYILFYVYRTRLFYSFNSRVVVRKPFKLSPFRVSLWRPTTHRTAETSDFTTRSETKVQTVATAHDSELKKKWKYRNNFGTFVNSWGW